MIAVPTLRTPSRPLASPVRRSDPPGVRRPGVVLARTAGRRRPASGLRGLLLRCSRPSSPNLGAVGAWPVLLPAVSQLSADVLETRRKVGRRVRDGKERVSTSSSVSVGARGVSVAASW